MDKEKQELSQLDTEQLVAKILEFKQQLLSLKLNAATAHVKDYSLFKKLRRRIAQVSTFLRQKQHIASS